VSALIAAGREAACGGCIVGAGKGVVYGMRGSTIAGRRVAR
jgi:hypothetical protein